MSLTIDLVPELETKVRQVAKQVGVAPDRYVTNLLEQHLAESGATPPISEATLLKQVNLGLPPAVWERYRQLRVKFEDNALIGGEQQELVALTDLIEEANVRRVHALIQLAELRKTTLDALMDELGLRPSAYV